MSAQLLASKVAIVEEEPRVRSVAALPTAVLGAVGITERGPIGKATLVTSFEEFIETFGGYTPNSDLSLAAQGYFENGGQILWVVRTVHFSDINVASSKTSTAATLTLNDRAASPLPTIKVDAKWDGSYANDIRVVVAAATSGNAGEFNFIVEDNGLVVETFANLSMDAAKENYFETAINHADRGSKLVKVEDLNSTTASPANMAPAGTFGPLAGGGDGLAGLADSDFVGSPAGKNGLRALDCIQDLSLLIVPGRATAAMHNAMVSYCEVVRDKSCFAVFDCPANLSAPDIVTYVDSTAAIGGLTEFAAIYWPRIKILNPSRAVFGNTVELTVPPSGHIAGVYARVDSSRPGGVYVPPAGIENGRLFGVIGFETDDVLEEAKRDLVFPRRINPLTAFPGAPRHIDGARTLKGNGNFPTVAERRGVIFIEQSLKLGLLFAKHQNNTEGLRATLARTVTAFLLIQLKNSAFSSSEPKKAFFVDFGEALNTPSVIFAGQVIGRIGLATAKPAEFIVLRFSQDTRALEAELAGSA